MKATVEYKNNCIAVKTKHQTEILYDSDLLSLLKKSSSLSEFCDEVFDYFLDEMEDTELNYKDISEAAKKFYRTFKE